MRNSQIRVPVTAHSLALLCSSALLLVAGCGPELDPISRVDTLRIMGVQKSEPFAHPGETAELLMLWEDPREESSVPIETFFAFWCMNPPGGLFGACLNTPPGADFEPQFQTGSSNFQIEIPEDALRPSLQDPRLPDSGSAIVFYGVCAGELSSVLLDMDSSEEIDPDSSLLGSDLMPRCLNEDGEDVSPDDFVIGYSTVLIYEELRNQNPILIDFEVNGEAVQIDCIDEECDGPFALPDLEECEEGFACIESCKDDGAIESCPEININALVDPSSAEPDEVAMVAYGNELEESIWVNYFTDRGDVSPPVKLVNDADLGFQEDYASKLYAPSEPGPLRIWATVRDNRGGVAWIRIPAYVK